MYNNYFGFSESPFNITPSSRFYFRTPSCEEVLGIVHHGIETRKGVIVVTGLQGTGKTPYRFKRVDATLAEPAGRTRRSR